MVVQTPRPPVLVVEDCPDNRDSLALLLRLWGYDVCTAHDGPSALHTFRLHRPAVALLDIGLPGAIDGWQLARMLRAQGGPLLLIAVTGYGRDQDRARSRAAGFDAHRTKPAEPDELRRLLCSAAPLPHRI
jgi:CheY-like chemotaxis protein